MGNCNSTPTQAGGAAAGGAGAAGKSQQQKVAASQQQQRSAPPAAAKDAQPVLKQQPAAVEKPAGKPADTTATNGNGKEASGEGTAAATATVKSTEESKVEEPKAEEETAPAPAPAAAPVKEEEEEKAREATPKEAAVEPAVEKAAEPEVEPEPVQSADDIPPQADEEDEPDAEVDVTAVGLYNPRNEAAYRPAPLPDTPPPEPALEPEQPVSPAPIPPADDAPSAEATAAEQEASRRQLATSAPGIMTKAAAPPPPAPEPVKKKRVVRTLDLEAVKQKISTDTDKYKLGDRLGKGAYGLVVRGTNVETGEEVAVKRISREILKKEGPAGEKRLFREVAIMGSLNHPNLVNMTELMHKEGSNEMWIIVELVEGCELMNRIDREVRLPEDLARKYFQQIVVGMHYVHSQGVVHRDLKPENILVTKDDVCKITDFGLSNVQNTDTMGQVPANLNVQTCCGTPYYVAPEVVTKKEGYSGFTSDVWSLGIILYVMLVGELPFTAKDLRSLLHKISKGDYKVPAAANLSNGAKDLIARILVPKVKHRMVLSEIAEHPWFVKGGFDPALMRVEDTKLDAQAVDHLTSVMDDWGKAKDEAKEAEAGKSKTLALGRGGKNNRAIFAEMTKNMGNK